MLVKQSIISLFCRGSVFLEIADETAEFMILTLERSDHKLEPVSEYHRNLYYRIHGLVFDGDEGYLYGVRFTVYIHNVFLYSILKSRPIRNYFGKFGVKTKNLTATNYLPRGISCTKLMHKPNLFRRKYLAL